jgi:hypothetical protein
MSSELRTVYRRAGEFAVRSVGGETILVPIKSRFADFECVYTLDAVGDLIWRALEVPKSEDDLVRAVLEEFDAEEAQVRSDVADFVADLEQVGIVGRERTAE